MYKLLPLLFLLSLVYFSRASTTVKCDNQGYAGKKLDFFKYSDPITKEREFVFSLQFDSNGKSISSTDISKTSYVFSDFGIYQGMLFLEPDQTLDLKLPPFREKSFAEQKNPYFSPVSFWFVTESKNELNDRVSGLIRITNQLTDKHFNQLYFRQSQEIFDSILYQIDEKYPDTDSETFNTHKKLSIKSIEVEAFRLKPEKYSALFSGLKQDQWLQPAFIILFEQTFGGQLSFGAKSINGTELKNAVNQSDLSFLVKFIQDKYRISGEIVDLALLKMLYDGFYSGYFSNSAIKELVKNERFTKNSNNIIRKASLIILNRFNHLQKGTEAPVICLNDLNGNKNCTNSNKDKFKYLVFADSEMIVCREQLKYLSSIDERFQKYLEIFVIHRDTDKGAIKKFLDENEITGLNLIDENNIYISEYNVKSFPVCFLLDDNHMVQFTNTKAPLEGFEQQFGSFLQQELLQRQRNQSR
jgi:hypothetical protein